jgi:uncharacterized protein (DUF169 family)
MSETLAEYAQVLSSSLELDRPPVQISYLDAPPAGVAEHPGGVPSVCTFFAEARDRSFYAALPAHEDCEIGAFVLGIPPKGSLGTRVMGTIGEMQQRGYLGPGEEARVPHNATPPKFVAYGPLGSLPTEPTGILLFAKPKAVMLALETAHFTVPVLGRPMCSIMPTLAQGAPVAISAGCTGSRVYTQLGDDRMIVGIRGDHLEKFVAELRRIRTANDWVESEDRRRKAAAAHPYQDPP